MLRMQRSQHFLPSDLQDRAVGDCSCDCYPDRLVCGDAFFTQEIARGEKCNGGFLASFGNHAKSHLSLLDVEHRVRGLALRIDELFWAILVRRFANSSTRKKFGWIKFGGFFFRDLLACRRPT